jgi:AMMECR1 domain-containing protein
MVTVCLLGGIVALAGQEPSEKELIDLARAAVRAEVMGERPPVVAREDAVRPVFVTIEIKGTVVGCRGSLDLRGTSLEAAVIEAARSAARHDPRYRPLSPASLKDFLVTVTIVDRVEPIRSVAGLTAEDGLVLESGGRRGVVLPWEGKDPYVRLGWAYKKAGVSEGSAATLERLVARRFRG